MITSPPMLHLSDAGAAARLRQHGFAVLDLLEAPQVETLLQLWSNCESALAGRPYASTLFSPDRDLRAAFSAGVAEVLAERLAWATPGSRLVYAGFATKPPNEPASLVPFHQDPSFVDEARFGAANIWIPLVDLDEENGPLWVVPGSQRFNRGLRGFNQAFAYASHEAALLPLSRPIHARAGQAIVFAHTLFHFSPANRSDRARPAAGGLLTDAGAPLFYPFVDPDERGWIELYDATPELFLAAPISSRPVAPLLDRRPVRIEPFDPSQLRVTPAESSVGADQALGSGLIGP